MATKEKQKKLEKIRKIMNACCMESMSIARYTIEDCNTESGIYQLLFAYNRKDEVVEARLAECNDMIDIAHKIRRKSQGQLEQCSAIRRVVAEKYNVSCCVEVINHRYDTLRAELYFKQGTKILRGPYIDIIEEIMKGELNESK